MPDETDRRCVDASPRRNALALVVAVAVVWNLVGNLLLPSSWYVPANLAVAALVVAIALRAGSSLDELGLARRNLARGVVVGLVAGVVVAGVLGIGLLVPALESAFEDPDVAGDTGFDRWFMPLVRIPLGTAVFEELLFRSVVLGLLLAIGSRRSAILWSSVLFGLWHVVPGWETSDGSVLSVVGTVTVTALAGAGFALLRLWSGSVVAPVLAHVATNSLAYVAALLALDVID